MLNGFCMAIKRSLRERIGLLDAGSFAAGYAEEIDYCFRATDAGFRAIVADTAYVFHAKSRSYGHELRQELARRGRVALAEKYGPTRLEDARAELRANEALALTRSRVRRLLDIAEFRDAVTRDHGYVSGLGGST